MICTIRLGRVVLGIALVSLLTGRLLAAEENACDITGNWRYAGKPFIPEVIIDEPALDAGQEQAFEQEISGISGEAEIELLYRPSRDIDPDHPGDAILDRFEDFRGLKIDGETIPLKWEKTSEQPLAYAARHRLETSGDNRKLHLSFTWHDTRPPQTRLIHAKFSREGSKFQAIAPPGREGELIVAHGIPFLSAGVSEIRERWITGLYPPYSQAQGPTPQAGLIASWNDGVLKAGDAEVQTIHFLGMVHLLDWANGSWYAPKGDHTLSHFVGDKVGEIVLAWSDGGETSVPLILGWNVWYGRPWDMTWHFNQWGGKAVNCDDQLLFGGDPKLRRIIPENLALVDGVRPRGAVSTNARFIFSIDLEGRKLHGITLRNVPELRFGPMVSAVTLEVKKPLPELQSLPKLSPVDKSALKIAKLDAIEKKEYERGVNAIMHLLYTFVDELPQMKKPDIPEGYFGPQFDFGSRQDAVYAATYLYYNGPGCASLIADTGVGCTSPVASGMNVGNYTESSGVWLKNKPFFGSFPAWFEKYRKTEPGNMPGLNNTWSRAVGELLREAGAFGYDKFFGTYTDWVDRCLFNDATPPHWVRTLGMNVAPMDRQVGGVHETGNRENDGHGITMWGRYMVWHWGGRSKAWNEKHFAATKASVEWLQWQLDSDTIFPGVRKDVLFTESECAHGNYDFYSSYNCLHGLKLAIRMAQQLDRKEEVNKWTKLYARLQQGIFDNLVDTVEGGPIWHTYPHCDWQDHAHKLAHLQLATEGDSYTPLQDYAKGVDLDRKYLEIDGNTYRFLMRDKNYNCLRMYGYGQGMMTQAALLMDEMADAEQFVRMLLRHAYLPNFGKWASPEGIMVHRSGKYYVAVNGYTGQDSHIADSTKAIRLMLGIDDNDPDHLRLIPRFPADWTPISVRDFPVLVGQKRQRLDYTYRRDGKQHEFDIQLNCEAGPISVRLGPLPEKSRIASATLDEKPVANRVEHSGDSDWVWIETKGGSKAKIVVKME